MINYFKNFFKGETEMQTQEQLLEVVKSLRLNKTPWPEVGAKVFEKGFLSPTGKRIHMAQLSSMLLAKYPECRVYTRRKKENTMESIYKASKKLRAQGMSWSDISQNLFTQGYTDAFGAPLSNKRLANAYSFFRCTPRSVAAPKTVEQTQGVKMTIGGGPAYSSQALAEEILRKTEVPLEKRILLAKMLLE